MKYKGFPGGSAVKNPPADAGAASSIPGSGRCPEEENGYPLQYSCRGNSMDRQAWWATVHGSQRVGHNGVLAAGLLSVELIMLKLA